MRHLTGFEVEGAETDTVIRVVDAPGAGGAHHEYAIQWLHPEAQFVNGECRIKFQNGPVREYGVNGVTQEQLLAIVADRLDCFQRGPFPSADNAEALELVLKAIDVLHRRTRDRVARNVEGRTAA